MSERSPGDEEAISSADKTKDVEIFDWLNFFVKFGEISDCDIDNFKNRHVLERSRDTFAGLPKESQKQYALISTLSDEQFRLLKEIALKENSSLPGIHEIRGIFAKLSMITGESKYVLMSNQP